MYFKRKLHVNAMKEADLKIVPSGWEPDIADKAKSYLKRTATITMGERGPYFIEKDARVMVPMQCFEYMIAAGSIEALSVKEYRKRQPC